MPRKYDRPAVPPPSLKKLAYYLRDARPTAREIADDRAGCEKRRVEAVDKLLKLARNAIAQANNAEQMPPGYSRLRAMPTQLRQFLEIQGLRILLADDPVRALRRFLGRLHGRGPAADKEQRELEITGMVVRYVNEGMAIEQACEAVASEKGIWISADRVRKIYLARRDEWRLRNMTPAEFDSLWLTGAK
jgi:hypothetical protein